MGVESPMNNGQSYGQAGTYERIYGRAYGELDPNDAHNTIITDLALAPRNAKGRVEYDMTFSLAKPIDMARSNGVLSIRWSIAATALPHPDQDGRVSFVSGWQGDVTPTAANQTMRLPVAKNPDGSRISGPFVTRWMNTSGASAQIIIPRNEVTRYPTTSMDTAKFTLNAIASETATGVQGGVVRIPAGDWAFSDCRTVPFPGTPDDTRVCLRNGFDPNLLYELFYTVYDPIVSGIGLAATRDLNSFFRYAATDDAGTANPVAGKMKWGMIEGTSQSGTFVKLLIMLGFNLDEQDRMVWDGANPNIAARVTDLNRRFATPGGLVVLHELGHEAAAWYGDWPDSARGRPAAGILTRCTATHSCPKILETFGATEIYGLRHSFVLVGTDAKQDLPLPDNVKRYYMASSNHGGGGGGFASVTPAVGGCYLPSNPTPTNPMRAALTVALVDWVTKGTPMPPTVYPKLADQTLVQNTTAAMGYPTIPGAPSPEGLQYPLLDYDLGPSFRISTDPACRPRWRRCCRSCRSPWRRRTRTATSCPDSRRRCCRIRSAPTPASTRFPRASRRARTTSRARPQAATSRSPRRRKRVLPPATRGCRSRSATARTRNTSSAWRPRPTRWWTSATCCARTPTR